MQLTIQYFLITLIIFLAATYAVIRTYRTLKGKNRAGKACHGCKGCAWKKVRDNAHLKTNNKRQRVKDNHKTD